QGEFLRVPRCQPAQIPGEGPLRLHSDPVALKEAVGRILHRLPRLVAATGTIPPEGKGTAVAEMKERIRPFIKGNGVIFRALRDLHRRNVEKTKGHGAVGPIGDAVPPDQHILSGYGKILTDDAKLDPFVKGLGDENGRIPVIALLVRPLVPAVEPED